MKEIILTLLMAMVPVIELRGALPFGVAQGLNIWLALVISIIGNLIPVPFIVFFIEKIFNWLEPKSKLFSKFVNFCRGRASAKKDVIDKYKIWGLVVLVAIPLPGTGAWTGALVAALFDIPPKKAFPAIALGVVIAGIIVMTITYGVTAIF